MEAMVPTPQRNPMAPGTQQVIQSKSKKMYQPQQQQQQQQPPPHVLSILETKKKDGRQVETQTMEKRSEQESLQLEALSSSWSKTGKKRKGVVRLRLARFGRKKAPFYRIHVADSRAPRDGRFLERIGYYDPKPGKDGQKRIALNFERAKYWLSVGAQPSDTVRHILCIAGLLPRPLLPQMSNSLAGVRDEEDEIDLEEDEDDDGDVERSSAESELSAL